MFDYNDIVNLILNNIKTIIFPEDLLAIDLSMSKYELLALMIIERNGEISMTALADKMNIAMSTATGIVDRLCKKGYLLRERTEVDRRAICVKLSAEGKCFTDEFVNKISGYIKVVYDAIDEKDREEIFRIAMKAISAIREHLASKVEKEEPVAIKKIEIL